MELFFAYAGVKRLELDNYITEVIDEEKIMPAVGQGAIAVEVRENDNKTMDIINRINHIPTALATTAQRHF